MKKFKSVKKSISMPGDLMAAAEERATEEQRSLSSYLQRLVAADLKAAKAEKVKVPA